MSKEPMSPLYANVPTRLKDRLEEIALARKRSQEKRERVTVTDLVIEALEDLVAREDGQHKAGAGQGSAE